MTEALFANFLIRGRLDQMELSLVRGSAGRLAHAQLKETSPISSVRRQRVGIKRGAGLFPPETRPSEGWSLGSKTLKAHACCATASSWRLSGRSLRAFLWVRGRGEGAGLGLWNSFICGVRQPREELGGGASGGCPSPARGGSGK